MVSIDESDDDLLKKLLRHCVTKEECKDLLDMPDTCRGRCVILPSNQTVIRLKRQLRKYDMMDVVSHECFHAAAFILDRIGMKLELYYSDEAYAYLLSFLVKEITKKLNI